MATVIRVTRSQTYYYPGMGGSRRSFRPDYTCHGPDGKRFTNTSKAELLAVLRRNYGPVQLQIVEEGR